MEDGQFREAESEEQKSLPFNFRAPRLQLTQDKLQTLLADIGKGTSWLNMYKMTAKACEAIQPLPHNFAMPKVEPHPSDKQKACSQPLATEGQGCRCTHEASEAVE